MFSLCSPGLPQSSTADWVDYGRRRAYNLILEAGESRFKFYSELASFEGFEGEFGPCLSLGSDDAMMTFDLLFSLCMCLCLWILTLYGGTHHTGSGAHTTSSHMWNNPMSKYQGHLLRPLVWGIQQITPNHHTSPGPWRCGYVLGTQNMAKLLRTYQRCHVATEAADAREGAGDERHCQVG